MGALKFRHTDTLIRLFAYTEWSSHVKRNYRRSWRALWGVFQGAVTLYGIDASTSVRAERACGIAGAKELAGFRTWLDGSVELLNSSAVFTAAAIIDAAVVKKICFIRIEANRLV